MIMKHHLKELAARTAGRWYGDDPASRVVVLCYHSIHPTKWFRSATPDLFSEQLAWLRDRCHIVPLDAVAAAFDPVTFQRPRVAITFDDGYLDNYEYALPLLSDYHIPATFFLTTGLLDKDRTVLHRFQLQRRTGYDGIKPLEWRHARDMMRQGMSIGAHTCTHPNLAQLDRAQASEELSRSKAILEDRLGCEIDSMAYPYGKPNRAFTRETVEIAAECGYRVAVSVLFRGVRLSDDPLKLPRFFVQMDNVECLSHKIAGWWDLIGWWQEKAPRWVARAVSPLDFTPESTIVAGMGRL